MVAPPPPPTPTSSFSSELQRAPRIGPRLPLSSQLRLMKQKTIPRIVQHKKKRSAKHMSVETPPSIGNGGRPNERGRSTRRTSLNCHSQNAARAHSHAHTHTHTHSRNERDGWIAKKKDGDRERVKRNKTATWRFAIRQRYWRAEKTTSTLAGCPANGPRAVYLRYRLQRLWRGAPTFSSDSQASDRNHWPNDTQ